MSLIDSEAEKLAKLREESEKSGATGRPAASAGLGRRFGALNKANKAVEKLKSKMHVPPGQSVEHFRGTISEETRQNPTKEISEQTISENSTKLDKTEQNSTKTSVVSKSAETQQNSTKPDKKPLADKTRQNSTSNASKLDKTRYNSTKPNTTEQNPTKPDIKTSENGSGLSETSENFALNAQEGPLEEFSVGLKETGYPVLKKDHAAQYDSKRNPTKLGTNISAQTTRQNSSEGFAEILPAVDLESKPDKTQYNSTKLDIETSLENSSLNTDPQKPIDGFTERKSSEIESTHKPDKTRQELSNEESERVAKRTNAGFSDSVTQPSSFIDELKSLALTSARPSSEESLSSEQPEYFNSTELDNQDNKTRQHTQHVNSTNDSLNSTVPNNSRQELGNSQQQPGKTRQKLDSNPTSNPTSKLDNLSGYSDVPKDLFLKVQKLTGLQNQLFKYIAITCIEVDTDRVMTSYEKLADLTAIKPGSIRTTAKNLKNEGLINIDGPKGGRGAILTFSIPVLALDAFKRVSLITKRALILNNDGSRQLDNGMLQTRQKPDNQPDKSSNTSISSIIFNKEEGIPSADWVTHFLPIIESTDLKEFQRIGIDQSDIFQIWQTWGERVGPRLLAEYLYRFLQYCNDGKANNFPGSSKSKLFYGMLNKKVKEGACLLDYVISEEDQLIEQQLDLELRQLKAKQAERENKEKELFDLAFDEWFSNQTQEFLENILIPSKDQGGTFELTAIALRNGSRNYFRSEVWDKKKIGRGTNS